jgi:hypothetical protein
VSGRAHVGSRTGNPRPDARSGPTHRVTTVGNFMRIITRYWIPADWRRNWPGKATGSASEACAGVMAQLNYCKTTLLAS